MIDSQQRCSQFVHDSWRRFDKSNSPLLVFLSGNRKPEIACLHASIFVRFWTWTIGRWLIRFHENRTISRDNKCACSTLFVKYLLLLWYREISNKMKFGWYSHVIFFLNFENFYKLSLIYWIISKHFLFGRKFESFCV